MHESGLNIQFLHSLEGSESLSMVSRHPVTIHEVPGNHYYFGISDLRVLFTMTFVNFSLIKLCLAEDPLDPNVITIARCIEG